MIGCVELCDKDDENNALHHRDCVGAVFSSLNIDVNDLSSSNQINIAFLSLFLQLLETGNPGSGHQDIVAFSPVVCETQQRELILFRHGSGYCSLGYCSQSGRRARQTLKPAPTRQSFDNNEFLIDSFLAIS